MEEWQCEHIKTNLPKLLRLTLLNETFLALLKASGTLDNSDVYTIQVPILAKDAQVTRLYNVIQAKINGYWNLLEALDQTNQTGAVQVILNGVPVNLLKNFKVLFLGEMKRLNQLLTKSQIQSVANELTTGIGIAEYVKLLKTDIKTSAPIQLIKSSIPEASQRAEPYIQRQLKQRHGINPSIFSSHIKDVFVFKNIDEEEFKLMVGEKKNFQLERSSKQLLLRSFTSNFISLDKDIDWPDLKSKSKDPIHLVEHYKTTKELVLAETSGGSTLIHHYLIDSKSVPTTRVPADVQLLEFPTNTKGFCVCDSPGMGKSVMLANLAREAASKYPERIVSLHNIYDIFPDIKQIYDIKIPITAIHVLLKISSTSKFAYVVLKETLKKVHFKFDIFVDALDEINLEDEVTMSFLTTLLDTNLALNVKLYLASRKHVRHQIEKIHMKIAYEMESFSPKDQVNFLTCYWQNECSVSSAEKLQRFAQECVNRIKRVFTVKDNLVTGVPLQCWLVAEVYSDNARIIAHPGRDIPENTNEAFHTLPEIYERLVKIKLGESKCNFACLLKNSCHGKFCSKSCEIINFHVAQAMQTILPDFMVRDFQSITINSIDNKDLWHLPGLLEPVMTDQHFRFKFLHLTIAEYLVARFFISAIEFGSKLSKSPFKKALKLMFERILHMKVSEYFENDIKVWMDDKYHKYGCLSDNDIVVYFISYLCSSTTLKTHTNSSLFSLVGTVSPPALYNILLFVLQRNYKNLFEFIKIYMYGIGMFNRKQHKKFLLEKGEERLRCSYVLIMGILHYDVSTVKEIVELLNDSLRLNVFKHLKSDEFQAIVYIVTQKPDSKIVHFFLDNISNNGDLTISTFIIGSVFSTANLTPYLIQERIKTITLFAERIPNTINIFGPFHKSMLRDVHPNLLKHLFKISPNFNKVSGFVILQACATSMSSDDFLNLCKFLIEECQGSDFIKDNLQILTIIVKLYASKIEPTVFCQVVDLLNVNCASEQHILKALVNSICEEEDVEKLKVHYRMNLDLDSYINIESGTEQENQKLKELLIEDYILNDSVSVTPDQKNVTLCLPGFYSLKCIPEGFLS